MQKRVWVTSMSKDQDITAATLQLCKKYGLAPNGHFWVDELEKMAWQAPLDNLLAKETALWVICTGKKDLEKESVRYGLSLLCLSMQHARGIGFPIVFVTSDDTLAPDDMPTVFRGGEILAVNNKSLGAKLTARANTPVKAVPADYRLNIHANPGYGIWFEAGPAQGKTWNGVLAGGHKCSVNAHGVGPKGMLPLKTTLEYQMQGLKLALGDDEYTAWAVKNTIDEETSYFFRFEGIPGAILFGELPDGEQADLNTLTF
ncbi:hypothetical protein [uncultured Desulfobacter sp.]|uniref:hypothetical protein n=1 Tax=uncultured Desulfobacter sp. TaxID=240139 RepID=UPI002AABF2B0|nr:hypothetical protein [uncultured Desulfobacter sp.]